MENSEPMIRSQSEKQLSLAEFDWPFQTALDESNRWVRLSAAYLGTNWHKATIKDSLPIRAVQQKTPD